MNRSFSSRFLYEATNQRWSSFLHEATGRFELPHQKSTQMAIVASKKKLLENK
jgi:hypothetical protein